MLLQAKKFDVSIRDNDMFKILLVEDNKQYRVILKKVLTDNIQNIEVDEACNASEALNATYETSFDLIFMDINLNSKVTGLDLVKIIYPNNPFTQIAILSNQDVDEYRTIAEKNGVKYFFTKSESLPSIIHFVNELILLKQLKLKIQ